MCTCSLTGFITTVEFRVYIQISLQLLPGSMAEEQPAPGPSYVPSQEDPASLDIEELVRATRLCDTCQPIFDDLFALTKRSEDIFTRLRHHPCCDSLRQSVEAGCAICTLIYERWQRYLSSKRPLFLRHRSQIPRLPGGRGVSFYCLIEARGLCFDVGPSDILDLGDTRTCGRLLNVCIQRLSRVKRIIEFQPLHQPVRCMRTAASWMGKCLSRDHRLCRKIRHRPHIKPSRLLFLDPNQSDKIRLISVGKEKNSEERSGERSSDDCEEDYKEDSEEDSEEEYEEESEDCKYVTLSHRWGTPEPPKLSRYSSPGQQGTISIEALEAGIAISDLPRTFREALYIVRSCGLQYIWIDCLCILQDKNPEGRNLDWEREAAKMADIYAGGVFNIAAIYARNSEAGLFPIWRGIAVPVVRAPVGAGQERQALVLWEDSETKFKRDVENSELLSRGWVYQEILFAPANLFCTADEMWWSCSRTTCSQIFPRGAWRYYAIKKLSENEDEGEYSSNVSLCGDTVRLAKGAIHGGYLRDDSTCDTWTGMISSYSGTSVTVNEDRLAAIAGVANLFRTRFFDELRESEYNSGVWSTLERPNGLQKQLAWKGLSFPARRYSAGHPIPSWSPMSFDGEIRYMIMINSLPVEMVNMGSSQLDGFGRAMEQAQCILHIRGVLVEVDITQLEEDEARGHSSAHVTGHEDVPIPIQWDTKEERQLAAGMDPRTYARLLVLDLDLSFDVTVNTLYFSGILLRPLDGILSSDGSRVWVRCGSINFRGEEDLPDSYLRHVKEVFQIEKYGLVWVSPSGEYDFGSWHKASIPHDLQDIYIA